MTGNQKKLFLNLCSFSSADGKEIEKNISKSMTPEVLGLLYANRMQTVAYKVIEKFGLFDLLGTEVCFQRVHGTAQALKIGIAYHKVGKEEINIL